MEIRFRLIDRYASGNAQVLRGEVTGKGDGAELTDVFPDFQPTKNPVLERIQTLRPLSPAESNSRLLANERLESGGSVVHRQELKGDFKEHRYG